ncbi:hypothetical protein [Polaribacter sp. Asnod6-C07]|uniref:hypothetical protein n=1 Tax=Polaribacter sp. Asnod6-C07 TaxID=3160582 RepID=UPI0038694FBC
MKNKKIGIFLILLILISCSSEDEINLSIENLSKWNWKRLENNKVASKAEYTISNNKITKYTVELYDENGSVTNWSEQLFFYENGKLDKTIESNSFVNDKYETKYFYLNNRLEEVISKHISNPNTLKKITFEYNGDKVKRTWFSSIDGGNNYEIVDFYAIINLTFDEQENIIESNPEGKGYSQGVFNYSYDEENNLIQCINGGTVYNYDYLNIENPISKTFISTFGKSNHIMANYPNSAPRSFNNLSPFIVKSIEGIGISEGLIENIVESGVIKKIINYSKSSSNVNFFPNAIYEFEYE